MKTIFNTEDREELVKRAEMLNPDAPAGWGKMTAYQMLKHCTMSEEMIQGKTAYKRLFAGKLFGKMVLKGLMKNENPIKKNQPTHPEMKITGTGDFEAERTKWIRLLGGYGQFSNPGFVHPFFGPMSRPEIGQYVYKHTDHHLRQFGV